MKCLVCRNHTRVALAAALFLLLSTVVVGQEPTPPDTRHPTPDALPTETYRLRVENTMFGRVEASVDEGAHYTLVGRVLQPVTTAIPDKTATTPGVVLRSVGEGLAFAVAPGQILKLRPGMKTPNTQHLNTSTTQPPTPNARTPERPNAQSKIEHSKSKNSAPEPAALRTDLEPKKRFFGEWLPPAGTTVRLQMGTRSPGPFPEGYAPGQEDVFLFLVALPLPAPKAGEPAPSEEQRRKEYQQEIGKRLEALGQAYKEDALARARLEKRPVVSGYLTLRAKLPVGEPEPISAVTYAVDGDVVAAQNVMPFSYGWDTRRVPDGEHVVEIRALSQYATVISRVRALVFVQNTPPAERP
jgi:hypothetical protein